MTSAPDGPPPIRDAATVVLLRDGDAGIDAWLLTRVDKMAFASGMTVFPGGRVDEADASLPWSGRAVEEFASDWGCEVTLAHALVGAAVRETFEETGVLLTRPTADLARFQPEVEGGRLAFGDLLAEHGLAVDADLVRPWARWITPDFEPRRYDTHFFVAALPDGAQPADVSTESQRATWVPVTTALAERDAGERPMLPPTVAVLTSIAQFATVADVQRSAPLRDLEPVTPDFKMIDNRIHAVLPDGTKIALK